MDPRLGKRLPNNVDIALRDAAFRRRVDFLGENALHDGHVANPAERVGEQKGRLTEHGPSTWSKQATNVRHRLLELKVVQDLVADNRVVGAIRVVELLDRDRTEVGSLGDAVDR